MQRWLIVAYALTCAFVLSWFVWSMHTGVSRRYDSAMEFSIRN